MSTDTIPATFLHDALTHAKDRWCWDDEPFIEELFADSPPVDGETPKEWIDFWAEKYDLIDPSDY